MDRKWGRLLFFREYLRMSNKVFLDGELHGHGRSSSLPSHLSKRPLEELLGGDHVLFDVGL
jgi:hypothetical protein